MAARVQAPILLIDGGMGTTLEDPPYNVTFTPDTPLWSSHLLISDPNTLKAVHRSFIEAGSDIILSATYQASIEGFGKTKRLPPPPPGTTSTSTLHQATSASRENNHEYYTPDEAIYYMRSAIPLARDAFMSSSSSTSSINESNRSKTRKARIALSLGPYGATITPVSAEYSGLYPAEMDSEEALRKWHADRLRIYVVDNNDNNESLQDIWNDDVEFVAFETVRRADEVRAIRKAVRDVFPPSPGVYDVGSQEKEKKMVNKWWITGVFPAEEDAVDKEEEEVRRWVRAAIEPSPGTPRPWGIGVNCTKLDKISKIVQIMDEEVNNILMGRRHGESDDDSLAFPSLVMYPDGTRGEKYDPTSKKWVKSSKSDSQRPWDEEFSDVITAIDQRGRWQGLVVGGCCRTNVKEIAGLRKQIDMRSEK